MKLARKLTLILVGGMCIILGVFTYTRIQRQYALFENDMKRDHLVLGHALEVAMLRLWSRGGEVKALEFIRSANTRYSQLDVRWVWLDAPAGDPYAPRASAEKLKFPPRGQEVSWVDRSGKGFVYTYIPVRTREHRAGALEVIESLDEEEDYVRTFVIRILATTFALTALAAAVVGTFGYWFVGRPMSYMLEMARRIGKGDYSKTESIDHSDEIGELATEMNRMCDQLAEARDRQSSTIAQLRETESHLSRSLSLFESILTDAPIGRAFVDRDLRYVLVNDTWARIHGKSIDEHLGKTVHEIPSVLMAKLEPVLRRVLEEGKARLNIEVADEYQCVLYPVRNERKEIQGVGLVVTDIAERKQAESASRKFLEHVVSSQEEERRRIARELHDGVGQILSALTMTIETIQKSPRLEGGLVELKDLQSRALDALDEINRLVRGLHPMLLDELGLLQAVDRLQRDFARTYEMRIDSQFLGFESAPRLPAAVEMSIYRIVQEALSNVAKHARATSANIVIERRADVIQTIIEDNGSGFESETSHDEGLGLGNIRERAVMLGGTFEIESVRGRGTTLYIRIPFKADA